LKKEKEIDIINRHNEILEFEKKKADWNLEKKKILDEILEVCIYKYTYIYRERERYFSFFKQ